MGRFCILLNLLQVSVVYLSLDGSDGIHCSPVHCLRQLIAVRGGVKYLPIAWAASIVGQEHLSVLYIRLIG